MMLDDQKKKNHKEKKNRLLPLPVVPRFGPEGFNFLADFPLNNH